MSEAPIGVVVYDRDDRPDQALAEAARRLIVAGVQVGGLLQEGTEGSASCCASLTLVEVGIGRRIELFQNRGHGARGCRLDPSGLAEASGWLRDAIMFRPEILFINRFGRQEADGRGLLDEIGAAVMAGIPMVIAVSRALLPEWRSFTGGEGTMLRPDPDGIVAWWHVQTAPVPA